MCWRRAGDFRDDQAPRSRQVNLNERVAKRVPHHEHAEQPTQPSGPIAENVQVDLSNLVTEQAQLTQALVVVGSRLTDFETRAGNSQKTMKISKAASSAIRQSEAALAAIQQGDVEYLRLQVDAATSLEALMVRQKNHHLAAYLGILTIAVILLWQGFAPRTVRGRPQSRNRAGKT